MKPITKTERFLARAAGNSEDDLTPITRQDHFLKELADAVSGGGGGSVSSVNGKTGEVVLTAADLDDSFKDALLDCFANVAWSTEGGQQYYDALEAALYPIDHITAVYTQSGTVYDTDSLDSLKADLVVTAFYQGGGSKVVATYTLSGTLTAGTSTITVNYGGKTATFDVTVKPIALYELPNKVTETENYRITTSKNGHIKIEVTKAMSAQGYEFGGFAINLLSGFMGDVPNAGILNQPKTFTIPANELSVFSVSNVVNNTNYNWAGGFKLANSDQSVSGLSNSNGTHIGGETVSTTFVSAQDVYYLFIFINAPNLVANTVIEFDVSFVVGEDRFI